MSRLYMLDTNTVSYIVKGKSPAARAKLANLKNGETACISIITEFELEFGLARKQNRRAAQRTPLVPCPDKNSSSWLG